MLVSREVPPHFGVGDAMAAMGISFAGLSTKMAVLQQEEATTGLVPARVRSRRKTPAARSAHNNNNNNNVNNNNNGQQPPPLAVARRNARERNRVKQVNNGFATLRQHIPASVAEAYASSSSGEASTGRGKKLSKVETLRMAVDYIRSLQRLLSGEEDGGASPAAATGMSASSAASPGPAGSEFAFVDDGAGGVLVAEDDLASPDDGSGSPFSLRQLTTEEGSLSPDERYLQQLYSAPPPGVVVKQERLDEEAAVAPPPGAVDRAVLEMMWWEQARRLRLIQAQPPSPS